MEEQTSTKKQVESVNPVWEEKGERIEGLPDNVTLLSDESFKIRYRDGTYFIFEDIPAEKIEQLTKIATLDGQREFDENKFLRIFVSNVCAYPKFTDDELRKMKSSKWIFLRGAVQKVYNLDSFL